jgi:NADH dehydrogenase
MNAIANIPKTDKQRIVVLGGGFAGLKLARKLSRKAYQVVLLDRNNYHMFQPLFYQVATAGLEPSAISFPLRKVFQGRKEVHIRVAEVQGVDADQKLVLTNIGYVGYDYLVLALGADTNYFGNENISRYAVPMKSLGEAIDLRNNIIENYEQALNEAHSEAKETLMNVVIVGGGPTGVELAGAIAEMKKFILPKDYPELDFSKMKVQLLEATPRVLGAYSQKSSSRAASYLEKLGVEVKTGAMVEDYDGETVFLKDGENLNSNTLIWAAGIKANKVAGLPAEVYGKSDRLIVDTFNEVKGLQDVFSLGDMAYMETEAFPQGHPQVAQVALQQADNLYKNLKNKQLDKPLKAFKYIDKGSLATVGRNLAIADLPFLKLGGFPAWVLWLFIHLMALVGVKNRLFVFMNWAWNYFTYDQSLRLLIRPKNRAPKNKVLDSVQ